MVGGVEDRHRTASPVDAADPQAGPRMVALVRRNADHTHGPARRRPSDGQDPALATELPQRDDERDQSRFVEAHARLQCAGLQESGLVPRFFGLWHGRYEGEEMDDWRYYGMEMFVMVVEDVESSLAEVLAAQKADPGSLRWSAYE